MQKTKVCVLVLWEWLWRIRGGSPLDSRKNCAADSFIFVFLFKIGVCHLLELWAHLSQRWIRQRVATNFIDLFSFSRMYVDVKTSFESRKTEKQRKPRARDFDPAGERSCEVRISGEIRAKWRGRQMRLTFAPDHRGVSCTRSSERVIKNAKKRLEDGL